MIRSLQRWGPVGAWASLILIATSAPIPDSLASIPPSGSDKLVHAAMYAVFGWLAARALGIPSLRATLGVMAVVSLFGAADEWHQQFISGRSRDSVDWVADTIGGAAGALAFQMARRRRESVS